MKPEIDDPRHLDQDLRRDVRARLPRLRGASSRAGCASSAQPVDWSYEIVFAALLGGVIGARAYYLIQNYDEVRHDLSASVFSGSGLVWYGGASAARSRCSLWMRWRGALELRMFDMCATALALGYAIGRIGCQVSGDGDYGIRSSLPWAMGYPHGTVPTPPGVRVQPTPIYETVTMCLLAYVLWHLRDRVRRASCSRCISLGSGLERFLVEFIRRNKEVFVGLTAPQLESVVLLVIGAAVARPDRCAAAASGARCAARDPCRRAERRAAGRRAPCERCSAGKR